MARKQKVKMLRLQPSGRTQEVVESKEVYAEVEEWGINAQTNALAVGVKLDLKITMFRKEYDDFTHAEVNGKQYKIRSIVYQPNPLLIRLSLERG